MPLSPDDLASDAACTIALQMLQERGRGAVLVGAARVDAALERLLQAVLLPAPGSTDPFFQPDRPLGSFGARITLAARLGLIELPVEQALQALRRVRNAFAHSTTTATLTDPGHADRLFQAYAAARVNSLWLPLERILQQQVGGPSEPPVEAGRRDYILLITILVAFLEAAAQKLAPQPPAVVMGFAGIVAPHQQTDDHH
ncbi:MAG: hypothetical protein NTW51_07475 [Cyanobacteria bacterium]|nr:hypothetical protein [Cyanobacteriota bacterium]